MGAIKEHSFIVSVQDKYNNSVSGAQVEILIDGNVIAAATTIGDPTRPIQVQLSEDIRVVTVRARVGELVDQRTVDVDVGSITLRLPDLVTSPPSSRARVPEWYPKAGFFFAALGVLFFMLLVILSLFEVLPPPGARNLVIILVSLLMSFAFAFLGADAAAKGRLPVPLVKEHPIEFSVGGAVAVFVVVLALLSWIYPEAQQQPRDKPVADAVTIGLAGVKYAAEHRRLPPL